MNRSLTSFSRFSLVTLAAFAAASTSFAQSEREHLNAIRALDTNKDRQISRQEAQPHEMVSKNFDAMDTDKNAQLSRSEIMAFMKANKADQDGDGNISKAEAANKPQLAKNFDEMDTNKDGILTPAERKAWMGKRKG